MTKELNVATPELRPQNPKFSSGPCAKRPGWELAALKNASLGRSHRAAEGKAKLKQAIELTRSVLRVPDDYRIGIVPASDTGAFGDGHVEFTGATSGDHGSMGIIWFRLDYGCAAAIEA